MDKIGKRNLKVFSVGAALNDIGARMYDSYLPFFAAIFLGVTPVQYGVIEGIGEAVNRIFRLFTGYFSDLIGRKVPVILGYIIISLSRLGLPLVSGWAGFIPFRALRQVGRSLRDPALEASIAESVPQPEHGRAFGILNAIDTIGSVFGPFIGLLVLYWAAVGVSASDSSGVVLTIWTGIKTSFPRESYTWLFFCAALPSVISAWIIYLFLYETKMPLEPKTPADAKAPKKQDSFSIFTFISSLKSGSPLRDLGKITLSHMILSMGAIPIAMILLYAYKDLSASVIEGMILGISYALAQFLSAYPAGWLSDRIGRFRTQLAANSLLILALLITIVVRQPLLLIFPLILYGIFDSIWTTNRRAAISDLAGKESFGRTLGNFSALYGFTSLICPILFGAIWSSTSSGWAFFIAALFPAAAMVMLIKNNKTR